MEKCDFVETKIQEDTNVNDGFFWSLAHQLGTIESLMFMKKLFVLVLLRSVDSFDCSRTKVPGQVERALRPVENQNSALFVGVQERMGVVGLT